MCGCAAQSASASPGAQAAAQVLAADEGRVADDELGVRPVRAARLRVGLAGRRRPPARVAVPGEHGVAADDVAEGAQDRRLREAAARAEVLLEVADPEDELGDRGGARVQLDAEELVRVDRMAREPGQRLLAAERDERVQDLAFEPLHQLERDVEEVAGAAGRVEHARPAERVVEGLHGGGGGGLVAGRARAPAATACTVAPVRPQRLDHRRHDEPLDIGARRVMRAEPPPLGRVERLFQQRAEDRGLDVAPIVPGRGQQFADLLAAERQRLRVPEQRAVEAAARARATRSRSSPSSIARHRSPTSCGKAVGLVAASLQQRP